MSRDHSLSYQSRSGLQLFRCPLQRMTRKTVLALTPILTWPLQHAPPCCSATPKTSLAIPIAATLT
jgi:hypothetical protein